VQEFLKERADQLQASYSEKVKIQKEWVQAVDKLLDLLEQWLNDADSEKILQVHREDVQRRESGVGIYSVASLHIWLEAQEVRIIPVARNAVGPVLSAGAIHTGNSFGRVDLTNGVSKFLMFRVAVDPVDRWVIVDEDAYVPRELNRQSFDLAVQNLLQ
jgi:hypothetical protein